MKKLLLILMVCVMTFVSFACKAQTDNNDSASSIAEPATEEQAMEEQTASEDQVIKLVYGHMSNPTDIPGQMADNLAALVAEEQWTPYY